MDIKIEIDSEAEPELHERLCEASQVLEEIMGPGAARFVREVKWSRFAPPAPFKVLAEERIVLAMTDPLAGTKSTMFHPVELRSPNRLKARLRDAWSEFLGQLFDERMERVDQLMETAERA